MGALRAMLAGLVLATGTMSALAQELDAPDLSAGRFQLRADLAVGLLMSDDQRGLLGFDQPGFEARVRGGLILHPVLAAEIGASAGAYLSSVDDAGGLLDFTAGLAVTIPAGRLRFWVSPHAGVGFTGPRVLPVLRLALGLDVLVADDVLLGPVVSYAHVFQEDGPQFTGDASILTAGVSLRLAPARASDGPVPVTREEPPPTRARRRRGFRQRLRDHSPPPEEEELQAREEEILGLLDRALEIPAQELLVPVLFEFDSTVIVPCSVAALLELRGYLDEHDEIRLLEVEGHADADGREEYNRQLSLRRSEAIVSWLVEHGVEAARLRAVGRGEGAPIEGNAEAPGRQQNRRVRFRVVEIRPGALEAAPPLAEAPAEDGRVRAGQGGGEARGVEEGGMGSRGEAGSDRGDRETGGDREAGSDAETSAGEAVAEDNGTEDNGTEDNGTQDNGTQDNGTQDNGTQDNGTQDARTEDAGDEESGGDDPAQGVTDPPGPRVRLLPEATCPASEGTG